MQGDRLKVGLLINPLAGLGGSLAFKGSDSEVVRTLAAEQGANPLTVAKAYQQFQNDGLVEVQRGVGMYVVEGAANRLRQSEREQFLQVEWPEIRARMDRLGVSARELLADA